MQMKRALSKESDKRKQGVVLWRISLLRHTLALPGAHEKWIMALHLCKESSMQCMTFCSPGASITVSL
jgi:hypothetical protein